MTDHINIENPVITFTDDTSNSIEQIDESLHVKHLPPQGMSRASQLLPFLPFGITTLWAWSKDGRFSRGIKLSPTITAWRNADVIEWLNSHTSTTSEV